MKSNKCCNVNPFFFVLLQIIATTIARQAQMLFNSLLICGAFWLIFAIMGVQMFAGKFYQVSHFLLLSSHIECRRFDIFRYILRIFFIHTSCVDLTHSRFLSGNSTIFVEILQIFENISNLEKYT